MSDMAIAVLAVAAVLLVALFLLRDKIKRLGIKTPGVEANIETHETGRTSKPAGIRIVANKLFGKRNRIDVERSNVEVSKNVQRGEDHEIRVASNHGENGKQP